MNMKRTNIHLLCNAHLDPVWLWQWQEGAAEAISTFRTAVELCESDNTFVFNHNEVILYEWVRQYEPQLFRRIQKLVRKGQWHIMGGWYLQPDCNLPAGESFVRQIITGKNYFRQHFGVDVTTAINFDPFGHTRGLVQILAKSGYDSYLFGRPDQKDCPLPDDDFIWVGFDGSEILASRFCGWYNSPLGKAREKIEQWLKDFPDKKVGLILWGVGNHGGGPSRKDLRQVNRFIRDHREHNIFHSTPTAYFKELQRQRDSLSRHKKDLNSWAPGCYSSQIRIKQKMRRLENELFATEKMASTAAWNKLMNYPKEQLRQAQLDLLNGQFHDILPGSSIKPVEEDSLQLLDHGLEITARLKAQAFFALAGGQKRARNGRIPIMVYNPHAWPVRQLVECEFNLPDFLGLDEFVDIQVYDKDQRLISQVEKEHSNLPIEWRKHVVFLAELKPGQMNRFDCELMPHGKKPRPKLQARNNKITFKSDELQVVINTRTGLIDRFRVNGRDITAAAAFQPVVMRDSADSWGMLRQDFTQIAGKFTLLSRKEGSRFSGLGSELINSVRVIEDGQLRSVIEAVFGYQNSFICQRYKLPKQGTEIEVETIVHWQEKDALLKLAIPVAGRFADKQFLGQVAYGRESLPVGGKEAVGQKWVAVTDRKRDTALSCINDGIYGCDFSAKGLRLTLLRSAAYSCHPWFDRIIIQKDRYLPRMEQGERSFRFWFNAGKVTDRLNRIEREALAHNEEPMALSFFPPGGGVRPKPVAILSDKVIQMTACKQAEKTSAYILRLFEPTGRRRRTELSLPVIGKRLKLNFEPFEIKTLKVNPRTRKIVETDLLEK